ncbi:hypothetical protein [Polymorphospora lycopeni]|uniref:Uncharacterized protein n=1 Tax=Polymorphospora lycopeni TaxID=3140240 RepID=A0ABV5CNE2_9ACTN
MPVTSPHTEGANIGTERVRLTDVAVQRLRKRFTPLSLNQIAITNGVVSRRTFYRLLQGDFGLTLTKALDLAALADLDVDEAFERVPAPEAAYSQAA